MKLSHIEALERIRMQTNLIDPIPNDDNGKLIINVNVWRWKDGSYNDTPPDRLSCCNVCVTDKRADQLDEHYVCDDCRKLKP